MVFYVIGILYFIFILEGMLKENREKIIFAFHLVAMYPIFSSLIKDEKYITLIPILSAIIIPIIAFKKFKFHRFMYSSFACTTTAFYIAEYSITKFSGIISVSLFAFSILMVTTDKRIWYTLLTALSLTLLSYSFTANTPITYVSFDYHIVYIPKLIFLTSILFLGILIPFSVTTQNESTSPALFYTTTIAAAFAVLHVKSFFSLTELYEFPLLQISQHLRQKFQLILFLFTLPFFVLLMRTKVLYKYLTSLVLIQSMFIILIASSSTVENSPKSLISYSLAAFVINSLIAFILLLFQKKKILATYLSISISIISILTPLKILFNLSELNTLNVFYIISFLIFIYFSVRLLLLNKFIVSTEPNL